MAQVWDLAVSENRRFLVTKQGLPFFWLGDTAWELFHRLTREDTEVYLENRRKKQFTVIQAVALAEFDGLDVPNPYGQTPLVGKDPTKPSPKYFEHVDWVINRAREKELYVGLLPTWGRYVVKGSWEKESAAIFNEANALAYGRWIGKRYRDTPNLIWILGGDRNPETVVGVWRAMAKGIKESDGGRHLITFHPNGHSSSAKVLHNEGWLDFNMIQSGHRAKNLANWEMIGEDYRRTPVKPVLDGEPRYEDHPVNWKPEEGGWFDDADVRQACYWALFSGAFGHTYGCHPIWQFATPDRPKVGLARHDWKEAMDFAGAAQMQHARALIESRDFLSRAPEPNVILNNPGEGGEHLAACRGDGYVMVYTPMGKPFALNLRRGRARLWYTSWFDPRTGAWTKGAEVSGSPERYEFTPPGTPGRGNDWILVLDSNAR